MTFFGVAWRATAQECREYVEAFDVPYRNGLDADEEVFAAYAVPYQPATIFVARDGTIVERLHGGLGEDELDAAVRRLLEV